MMMARKLRDGLTVTRAPINPTAQLSWPTLLANPTQPNANIVKLF
jgi:hypothetical protein